ncbi:MAG: 16S rRNA (cytosine(967)-C(5))-methyltransferase RsmB [Eubacterium sp.]|nr:16S rRNA (cytosine(967)-C(5))-methyltransferase RsmB [Eubacterium sp.]
MDQQVNVRRLALETLLKEQQEDCMSSILIREVLAKYSGLDRQERAFYRRLTAGTIEYRLQLDLILDFFSKTKTSKMKPVIREILRMGAYQILYMDSVPDSAAVNEAVKLAARKGFGSLKGFVNGVLRSVARDGRKVSEEYRAGKAETDPVSALAFSASMPTWLLEKWIGQLGMAETEEMCRAFLKERPLTARIRGCAAGGESPEDFPEGAGRCSILPDACYLYRTGDLTDLPAFRDGSLIIQDLAGQIAVRAAGIRSGDTVVDVCCAPGGKTILAADLCRIKNPEKGEDSGHGENREEEFTVEPGMVYGRDISEARLRRVEENLDRCRIDNCLLEVRDARLCDPDFEEKADVVIADVPCSGYGDIGRKPEIKYRAGREKEEALVKLQRDILASAVKMIKPGGTLLFSTCTINRAENEDNAAWLLENFSLEPADLTEMVPQGLKLPDRKTLQRGFLQILPQYTGEIPCDGFFFAVFRKKQDDHAFGI